MTRAEYREARQRAQRDFEAYRQGGGTLAALEWMHTMRPALFNAWVDHNSPGGQHDRYPMGRTRADGARMVRVLA